MIGVRAQRRGKKTKAAKKEKDDNLLAHEKDFIAFDLNADNYIDAYEIR